MKQIHILSLITLVLLCNTNITEAIKKLPQSNEIALQLIGSMQTCIDTYEQIIKNNDAQSLQTVDNTKELFTQSLNQYLVNFGLIQERPSGLLSGYKNHYYISSIDDNQTAITADEYHLLCITLQRAAHLTESPAPISTSSFGIHWKDHKKTWGSTLNLELSVYTKEKIPTIKNLTLDEIIGGIQRVPVSQNYSANSLIVGAAITAALAAGAYFASEALSKENNALQNPYIPATKDPSSKVEIKEQSDLAPSQVPLTSASEQNIASSYFSPKNIALGSGTALGLAHPRTRQFVRQRLNTLKTNITNAPATAAVKHKTSTDSVSTAQTIVPAQSKSTLTTSQSTQRIAQPDSNAINLAQNHPYGNEFATAGGFTPETTIVKIGEAPLKMYQGYTRRNSSTLS